MFHRISTHFEKKQDLSLNFFKSRMIVTTNKEHKTMVFLNSRKQLNTVVFSALFCCLMHQKERRLYDIRRKYI